MSTKEELDSIFKKSTSAPMSTIKSQYSVKKSATSKNNTAMDDQNDEPDIYDYENDDSNIMDDESIGEMTPLERRTNTIRTPTMRPGARNTANTMRSMRSMRNTNQNSMNDEMVDMDEIVMEDTAPMMSRTTNRIVTNPNRSSSASMRTSTFQPRNASTRMNTMRNTRCTMMTPFMMNSNLPSADRRVSFLEQFEEDDIDEKQLKSFQVSANTASMMGYKDDMDSDLQGEINEQGYVMTKSKKSKKRSWLKYGAIGILVVIIAIILIAIIYLIYLFASNNTINFLGYRFGDDSSGTDGNLVVEVRNENRNRDRRQNAVSNGNGNTQTRPGSTVINRVDRNINRRVDGSQPFIPLNTIATEDQNNSPGFILRRSRR